MDMKKIIQEYGNALIIRFNGDDKKLYGLKKGDIVEITITQVKEGGKKK